MKHSFFWLIPPVSGAIHSYKNVIKYARELGAQNKRKNKHKNKNKQTNKQTKIKDKKCTRVHFTLSPS